MKLSLYDAVVFGMGGGNSTTTTVQELSPEQKQLISGVIPIAQQTLANPPKMYPKSGITPFQPLQSQAQQMTINAANSMIPTANQQGSRFNALMGEYGQQMNNTDFLTSGDVLHPGSNPALQAAIEAASRPTIQNFQEQIMPQITQSGVASGGFGGTRQGIAEGIASRGATQTIGDIAATMASQNYQAGLGAMTQGMGIASNNMAGQQNLLGNMSGILGQSLLPAQLLEAVGGQQQAMKQAQLSEAVQRFVNQQMIPFSVAQDVAAMAFGMPGGSTKSTSTGGQSNGAGLQMAMGGMSLLPMLLGKSDRRVKNTIRKVNKLFDGLFVYAFKYIGTVFDVLGLMADEVELLYPKAVLIDNQGYKTVNYSAVPSWKGY